MLKKGKKLQFKDRIELITKASNNRNTGMVITENNEYSTDFIMRWLDFGFVKLIDGKSSNLFGTTFFFQNRLIYLY
jgi:hypothetical protein